MSCIIEGCDRAGRLTKSLCHLHYQRLLLHGDPLHERETAEQRFRKRFIVNPDGCWLWTGSINPKNGYGRIQHGGKANPVRSLAHRFAYELFVGPIPDGLTLDHLCHTADADCSGGRTCLHRRCCNPAHLEPTPRGENTLRGKTIVAANLKKTHCIHGHPFDAENTSLRKGHRVCKACRRDRYAAKRAAQLNAG